MQGGSGTVTVPGAVLAEIAARAAEGVDGVRVRRRRTVDVDARTVKLGLAAGSGEPLLVRRPACPGAGRGAHSGRCAASTSTVDVAIEELA